MIKVWQNSNMLMGKMKLNIKNKMVKFKAQASLKTHCKHQLFRMVQTSFEQTRNLIPRYLKEIERYLY